MEKRNWELGTCRQGGWVKFVRFEVLSLPERYDPDLLKLVGLLSCYDVTAAAATDWLSSPSLEGFREAHCCPFHISSNYRPQVFLYLEFDKVQ